MVAAATIVLIVSADDLTSSNSVIQRLRSTAQTVTYHSNTSEITECIIQDLAL